MHTRVCSVRRRRGEQRVVRGEWCVGSGARGRGTPKQKNEAQKITSPRGGWRCTLDLNFSKIKNQKNLIAVALGFWGSWSDFFLQSGPATHPTPAPPHPGAVHTPRLLRHYILCIRVSVLCVEGGGSGGGAGEWGRGSWGAQTKPPPPKKKTGPRGR